MPAHNVALAYHQEVCFRVLAVRSFAEDTAPAKIIRERYAQVRIIKHTEVIGLGRVASIDLSWLDFELGLS